MRYSTRALPAYRFVPGKAPHPNRDPGGHSFGDEAPVSRPWRIEDWREIEEYLWAVDLFNAEYWWESHEALEALWHAAGRTTAPARFVQSLVHLSAACLNRRRGHPEAAQRQAARAVRGLRAARGAAALTAAGRSGSVVMGIDLDRLILDVEHSFASDGAQPIRIELDFEAS
jgi:hypothetical protein